MNRKSLPTRPLIWRVTASWACSGCFLQSGISSMAIHQIMNLTSSRQSPPLRTGAKQAVTENWLHVCQVVPACAQRAAPVAQTV